MLCACVPYVSEDIANSETTSAGSLCCGCLCADSQWSCDAGTCLDSDGRVPTLRAQAGFFELAAGDYEIEGKTASDGRHRVWYSFQPAEHDSGEAPLFVLFNGGPGCASAPLLAFNTGPTSLIPSGTSDGTVQLATTREPWTQFAHLLYIDAPNTGFSYTLASQAGQRAPVAIDPDRDAANFNRVLLRFLWRHPQLTDRRVVMVGESYGGARATLMLDQLLHYEDMLTGEYRDPDLVEEISRHYAETFPDTSGVGLEPQRIAQQFGHMVAIQGLLAGSRQLEQGIPEGVEGCQPDADPYQCDQAEGFTQRLMSELAANLLDPQQSSALLGVDIRSIDWMYADAREQSYGKSKISDDEAATVDHSGFSAVFGSLPDRQNYFVAYNRDVHAPHPNAKAPHDHRVGEAFLAVAQSVQVLITDAGLDRKIWTPNLIDALAEYGDTLQMVDYDGDPRTGIARPGWLRLSYRRASGRHAPANSPVGSITREIRMPYYPAAGHMVTLRESSALLHDIRDWYLGTDTGAPTTWRNRRNRR